MLILNRYLFAFMLFLSCQTANAYLFWTSSFPARQGSAAAACTAQMPSGGSSYPQFDAVTSLPRVGVCKNFNHLGNSTADRVLFREDTVCPSAVSSSKKFSSTSASYTCISQCQYKVTSCVDVEGEPGETCNVVSTGIQCNGSEDHGTADGPGQTTKGEKGDKGDKGDPGAKGDKGEKGDKGDKGDAGEAGARGAQGLQGAQGERGEAGANGGQGAQGERGEKGLKGDKGDSGADGSAGAKGDKGDTGAAGAVGARGAQGLQGLQGEAGKDGADGKDYECDPTTDINECMRQTGIESDCSMPPQCSQPGSVLCAQMMTQWRTQCEANQQTKDFYDWVRSPMPTGDGKQETTIKEQTEDDIGYSPESFVKDYVQISATCPAAASFPFTFAGHSSSIQFDYQPLCDFTTGVRPFVIFLFMLAAAYIIARAD